MLKNNHFGKIKLLVRKLKGFSKSGFYKYLISKRKKNIRIAVGLVLIGIGFFAMLYPYKIRNNKDYSFLSSDLQNHFSSKENLERFTEKMRDIVQKETTTEDVELITDSYMNIDDLIPQLISIKQGLKSLSGDNKIPMLSVVFDYGSFRKISNKLREKEEIFIKNERNALKAIQILEGDMKKAKTMGNVMATLATSIPLIDDFYNKINTVRFLTQSLKADLSDLQSVMYAKFSVIFAFLGIGLALISFL